MTCRNAKAIGALATTILGIVSIYVLTEGSKPQEIADSKTYLADVSALFKKTWPENRTVNLVFHGHSVPAGYFKTPVVDSPNAYPHLLFMRLKERFPFALINVIVTAIGGETSESGAARFETDVLSHKPDVICIDYALNDRPLGLEKTERALVSMIAKAKERNIKVILLTPTADMDAKWDDPGDPLNQQAELIKALAGEYRVGLVDSLREFKSYVMNGGNLSDLMSQGNHPNRKGHELVAAKLLEWFPE
jgi:lysophospholipase L1-like esterase